MTQPISCAYSVSGDGPPLILVHGIGASRATWATALPLLEPHFRVISYDLRGHGASPQPEGRFGLDALVADLEHVREQAGVEAAHIAGHSLGEYAALAAVGAARVARSAFSRNSGLSCFASVVGLSSSSGPRGLPSCRPMPSLMAPFPRITILHPDSRSIRFCALPRGPISAPKKL